MSRFRITRADGRSNTQVICDHVAAHDEPGRIFTYAELSDVLSAGTDTTYTERAIQGAIRHATPALERQHKRTLHNVPDVGYRVARGNEHVGLSVVRQTKSNNQMKRALSILQHVRYEEMDDNTRRAHEGHLILTSALFRNQMAMDTRLRRAEAAIEALVERDQPTQIVTG